MMESAENGPLNIGSDWKNKFSEVAEKVIKITGASSKIKFVQGNEYMSSQVVPDISEAKAKLDWFPIVLLDEGLKNTIDYLSTQQGVLKPE